MFLYTCMHVAWQFCEMLWYCINFLDEGFGELFAGKVSLEQPTLFFLFSKKKKIQIVKSRSVGNAKRGIKYISKKKKKAEKKNAIK